MPLRERNDGNHDVTSTNDAELAVICPTRQSEDGWVNAPQDVCMRLSVLCALAAALLAGDAVVGQRGSPSHQDLEGTWSAATLTPLQRPRGFETRATFTPEEADEY